MPPSLQALGIDRMSIEADAAIPRLTGAQRAELERRISEHEAHPDDVIPWEQIKAEALARCGF